MKLNITDVAKFNPYHDERGRFTTGSGATSFTIRTKDPAKQYLADRAAAREKERHTQATSKPPVKRNDEFISIVGDARSEEVQDVAHKCKNENITRLWDEHFPEVSFQPHNQNSCYSPMFDTVRMNIDDIDESVLDARNEAIFHEVGHAIDHRCADKLGRRGRLGNTFSETFEDGIFITTLQNEYKALEKRYQSELQASKGGKVPISEAREYMRRDLSYNFNDGIRQSKDKQEWGNTWDIMQGCSKSKVQFPAGHDKSYYQGRFSDNHLGAEAFANMYSATVASPKSLANIKEYFPESYKVFERMLGEM